MLWWTSALLLCPLQLHMIPMLILQLLCLWQMRKIQLQLCTMYCLRLRPTILANHVLPFSLYLSLVGTLSLMFGGRIIQQRHLVVYAPLSRPMIIYLWSMQSLPRIWSTVRTSPPPDLMDTGTHNIMQLTFAATWPSPQLNNHSGLRLITAISPATSGITIFPAMTTI